MMHVLETFRLDGKTAVVTGCRRGIGHAYAVALAQAGADIVGVSASLPPSGSQVEQDVRACGRSFCAYACDLADRAALYRFIRSVRDDAARVDILVNNAGIIMRQPATEYADAAWDRTLEVNLNAQFLLAREFGRDMVGRGAGKIVFMASVLSYQGGILVPAYAASKGAITQLVKALANEWAALGVNVNAIAPGYVRTDATRALQEDPQRERQILERIPAGRWGRPQDVCGALVFLCSEAAAYVHGTTLVVDGGWLGR
jgi:2-deoxy-D-gluconate 3-dehydrogenase